jgi:simple sugar transport system ATP-binding protein
MLNDADLLILDEPTSVLTPQETGELFSILRRMREEGHSVILISHKLEEIIQICDRAVVLRKGSVVGETAIASVDKKDLARMMVGREVIFNFEKEEISPGEPVLQVRELSVRNDREMEAVLSPPFQVTDRRN